MNIKKQSLSFAITEQDVANNSMSENTIVDIPIDKIREISEQPFIIHEDTINTLVDSIKRNGQLDPCVVTQSKDNSDMYDLLAGRHRKRACELAGLKTCKCIIRNNLSDDEKELIIIDTNTERNNDYLPSELAFAFKRKEELLSKTTNSAIKVIANESNLSRKKVYRYIRLTYLIKPLLSRVDGGSIPLIAGVELSYLTDKEQGDVFTYLINHASDCKITTEKARLIKDNPADYEAILKGVFSSVGTPQLLEDVDNLSTEQVEQASEKSSNTSISSKKVIDKVEKNFDTNPIENEDNLSTEQVEHSSTKSSDTTIKNEEIFSEKEKTQNLETNISDIDSVEDEDDVDNLSTLQVENTGRTRVNTLEDNLIELVISVTHVDSYICNFYSKKEVTKLLCYSKFDETINEININSDGTYISFSSKNYNKFISLVNIYDLVREYIKNNYDITQIVEAYNYLH
jgi:ParB/RepB/Spo0J family partition protein